jgi:predicted DNA-binding transcriptional regulator YafY
MNTKTAMRRILDIDNEIAAWRYPTTKSLAKKLEVSTATISRDIRELKNFHNAPIAYSYKYRGLYYTDKTYRIPAGFTGAKNLAALAIIKSLLSQYQDNPMYAKVMNLLNSITAAYDNDSENKHPWFENRIVAPPVASTPLDTAIWDGIIKALQKNRMISFDYRGSGDSDFHQRHVRPYQLLFDSGAWYLYGHDNDRKDTRIFSLARMKNIALSERTFELALNYDYCVQTGGSFFGVFQGKKYHFTINFYEHAASIVRERRWAQDQKIDEFEGGLTISFTSSQYDKVLEWVLGKGCFAQPLEPKRLVDDWRYHISEMAALAEDDEE